MSTCFGELIYSFCRWFGRLCSGCHRSNSCNNKF